MSKPLTSTRKNTKKISLGFILLLATFSALTVYFAYRTGIMIAATEGAIITTKFALAPLIPFVILLILTIISYIQSKTKMTLMFLGFTCTVSSIILIFSIYIWLKHNYLITHDFAKYFFKNLNGIILAVKHNSTFFLLLSPILLIFVITVVILYDVIFGTNDNKKNEQPKHTT